MKQSAAVFFEKFDYHPQSLYGKAVLITGGTTDIGRTTGLLLASQGAHVMIFGRHEQKLNAALEAIQEGKAIDSSVLGMQADVSKVADIKRVFKEVDTKFKRLDILINNAVWSYENPADGTNEGIDTNLLGLMTCAREAVGRMKAAGEGHIVNIGSMSAQAHKGDASGPIAAIQEFSESFGREVSSMGIKVTLIEPGAQGQLKLLKAVDIAACVLYALTQPKRCDVTTVQIRPHLQNLADIP